MRKESKRPAPTCVLTNEKNGTQPQPSAHHPLHGRTARTVTEGGEWASPDFGFPISTTGWRRGLNGLRTMTLQISLKHPSSKRTNEDPSGLQTHNVFTPFVFLERRSCYAILADLHLLCGFKLMVILLLQPPSARIGPVWPHVVLHVL